MQPHEHATFRGRETESVVLDRTWRFSRFDMDLMDDYVAWARKYLPDPLEVAERAIERLAAEEYELLQEKDPAKRKASEPRLFYLRSQQQRYCDTGMDRATSYMAWDHPEVIALRKSLRGAAQLVYFLVRAHHPDATPQTGLDIFAAIKAEELDRILAVTMGKAPEQPAPAPPPTEEQLKALGLSDEQIKALKAAQSPLQQDLLGNSPSRPAA